MSSVFQRYLALANHVLSWNFLPPNLGRHYIAMFESSQNVLLKPTESWREALLDSRVMELFFTVHRKIREDSDMAQDSLQCLAQLASLHGPVFLMRALRWTTSPTSSRACWAPSMGLR